MGGMTRRNSARSVSPRSPTQHVGFVDEVVTGYSRPVTNEEHWTLYYFEEHAAHCGQCHNPYLVHKTDKQLCNKGHKLATDVARLVYYSKSRDGVFSRSEEDQQEAREVRVEIPANYVETLGLLRAIQRALRHGAHFLKPKSYDKTYLVPSRRHHADHGANSSSDESRSSRRSGNSSDSSDYGVKLVEPKPSKRGQRRDSGLEPNKRGSLYWKDMKDLDHLHSREQRLDYDVEIRRPSMRRIS